LPRIVVTSVRLEALSSTINIRAMMLDPLAHLLRQGHHVNAVARGDPGRLRKGSK
jgi:hypothetical protein